MLVQTSDTGFARRLSHLILVQTDFARFARGLLRLVLVGAYLTCDGAGAYVVRTAARSSVAIVVEFQGVLFVVATERFTVHPRLPIVVSRCITPSQRCRSRIASSQARDVTTTTVVRALSACSFFVHQAHTSRKRQVQRKNQNTKLKITRVAAWTTSCCVPR